MSGRSAIDVAENLLKIAQSEHDYRAAASRAYFAAFQHVRDHPRVCYSPSNAGEDHMLLVRHLNSRGHRDRAMVVVASGLSRVRKIRNHADYSMTLQFTKEMADEALERATDIIFVTLP